MIELTKERRARLIGTLLFDIINFQYLAGEINSLTKADIGVFINSNLNNYECMKDILEESIQVAEQHLQKSEYYSRSTPAEEIASEQPLKLPLKSVFSLISDIRKDTHYEEDEKYYKPGPISIEDIFPELKPDDLSKKKLHELHKSHWEDFLKDVRGLPENLEFKEFYTTLLAVLEKWTSRVSAGADNTLYDISLYDNSKVAAAYADCIAESNNEKKKFLIIEGDVSGIQSFIYRIANLSEGSDKGTAKTLRGRSFFIELCTEAITRFIMDKLGLLNVHLLINGGGGFTIIAPNTMSIKERLLQLRAFINEWLFEEFHAEIGLIMIWKEFSENEIKKFSEVKRQMIIKAGDAKFKKNLDQFERDEFWGPYQFENKIFRVCKQCGVEASEKNERCEKCEKHKKIGEILPHTKTILMIPGNEDIPEARAKEWEIVKFNKLNQTWALLRESKDNQTIENILNRILKYLPRGKTVNLIRLNAIDFNEQKFIDITNNTGKSISLQFRFMGLYVPNKNGEILSFEQLAKETTESYPMLGILRMDVDSLGAIFAFGFEPHLRTISRIAHLSRLFTLFFGGYINVLAKQKKIYINYSGGDDLFVIGAWDNVIEFAKMVRTDFKKFVSVNPHLTISGGIIIVRPNYPVRFAAEQAGEAEDKAKDLDIDTGKEKDALTVFNTAVHWDRFDDLIDWAQKISELIKQNKENEPLRNLVRFFKQVHAESFDIYGRQDINWIPRVMHKIHYYLKRRTNIGAKEIEEKPTELKEKVELLARITQGSDLLNNIRIPADYVLLKTRKHNDKNTK